MAALLWLVSYWTDSWPSRHLILLSVIFYVALLTADGGDDVSSCSPRCWLPGRPRCLPLAVLLPDLVEKIVRLDGRFAVHCLIGFLVGIGMAEIELIDETSRSLVILALIAFAGIAAAIVLCRPRQPRPALDRLCRLQPASWPSSTP